MADQDLSYTADIIRAALPYIDAGNKVMVEFMMKMLDLMGSLKVFRSSSNGSSSTAAGGLDLSKIDIEGLLNGIRPICRDREREIVDRILNIFSMKRMFEMYNSMMEAMKTMQEMGGFPFGDSPEDAENVTGNFSGSNFDSIFKAAENKDSDDSSPDTDDSGNFYNADDETSDSKKEKVPPPGNAGVKMNDKMFEMLKTMIPPEQQSTFENLSMLLNSMSYDNNSKPDDSKESPNG